LSVKDSEDSERLNDTFLPDLSLLLFIINFQNQSLKIHFEYNGNIIIQSPAKIEKTKAIFFCLPMKKASAANTI